MCCSKFQQCQFLLEEVTEYAEEVAICGTSRTSVVPHMRDGDVFKDYESELESECQPKQTAIVCKLKISYVFVMKT